MIFEIGKQRLKLAFNFFVRKFAWFTDACHSYLRRPKIVSNEDKSMSYRIAPSSKFVRYFAKTFNSFLHWRPTGRSHLNDKLSLSAACPKLPTNRIHYRSGRCRHQEHKDQVPSLFNDIEFCRNLAD